MANTANVNFKEQDLSLSVGDVPAGISGISGVFKRGPLGRTDILVPVALFKRLYGGVQADREDALVAIRALEGGSLLRVNNIRNYADVTDGTSTTAVVAAVDGTDGGYTISLTGSMVAGFSYTLTISGFTQATVTFNNNEKQTILDLIQRFIALNPGKVAGYQVSGTNAAPVFSIAPTVGNPMVSPTVSGNGITSTATNLSSFSVGGNVLFTVVPMGPGENYNKLIIEVRPATNGNSDYFNLAAWITDEEADTFELFQNIKIEGNLPEEQLHFLDDIIASSQLFIPSYSDLSGIASSPITTLVPTAGLRSFHNGSDGSAVTANDYIGSALGKTGVYSFAAIDDVTQIAAITTDLAVHKAYGDVIKGWGTSAYFAHLSNGLTTATALASARDGSLIDNSFLAFFAGGVKVIDPVSATSRSISELGDILGLAATSEIVNGADKSFAGSNRGQLKNVLGIVNNFGGDVDSMQLLANHNINVVCVKDGRMMLWGNFTAQLNQSLLSFLNTRRTLNYIKKSIRPVITSFIEEPNLPATWLQMFLIVKPFFEALTKSGALYYMSEQYPGWRWEGDQFAKALDDKVLTVNNKADVLAAKYKVRLFVTPTPSMQEVEIVMTVIGSSISFEEVLANNI